MTKETKPAKQETQALATYGEWTPEQMEKESAAMASGGDFLKIPVGRTVVRFLPPKIGWPSPFVIIHQHFIELPGVEEKIIFACPKMHESKKCLACGKADAMESSGNARDERAARKLRPSKRVMANVVPNPKNPEAKVGIYAFGKTVYDQLKSIREDDEGGGNFMDPIKGFNISITRVGTGMNDTKYTCQASRNMGPLLNMDWIENQTDLRKMVRIPTVEQQQRLFDGEDPRDVWGDAKKEKRRREEDDLDDDAIDVEGKEVRTAEDDVFDDDVDLD